MREIEELNLPKKVTKSLKKKGIIISGENSNKKSKIIKLIVGFFKEQNVEELEIDIDQFLLEKGKEVGSFLNLKTKILNPYIIKSLKSKGLIILKNCDSLFVNAQEAETEANFRKEGLDMIKGLTQANNVIIICETSAKFESEIFNQLDLIIFEP